MKIKALKIKYKEEIIPEMKEKFGYKNDLAVPRIEKVVINTGIGKFQGEKERVQEVENDLQLITGQKSLMTKAKKAISGFKIRENMEIGMKTTLRGKRMWDFMDRLINVALPRTRDFQGISPSAVDKNGNLNIGVKEHTIFPEVFSEKVKNIFSLQITLVTSAKDKKEGLEFFKLLGFPIGKKLNY
jgi:large subunit ribosomal protein L5